MLATVIAMTELGGQKNVKMWESVQMQFRTAFPKRFIEYRSAEQQFTGFKIIHGMAKPLFHAASMQKAGGMGEEYT